MKKKIGIVVGVLVLLLAAAGGIYYYMTNTPKNKYLLSEKQSIESWNTYFADRYSNELKLQEAMREEPYRSSVTFSAGASDTLLSMLGIPSAIVDSTSITLNMGHDEKAQQSELSLAPTFAGTEIDKFEWTADKDAQYIKTPLFTDKLMVKNADMKKVYERFTGESVPEDFDPNMVNLNKLMEANFTQQQLEEMQERYLKVAIESLEDEQFKKGSETTAIFGNDEKVDTVTMTLNNDDLHKVLKNIVAEMKKDEAIKNWYNSSMSTYDTQSYEETLDNLLEDVKSENFGTLVAKNYMDGKKILKRDITWKSDTANDGIHVMIAEKIDQDVQLEVVVQDLDSTVFARLEGTSKGAGNVVDEYKLTIGEDDMPFIISMKNDEKVDGDERTNNIDFIVEDDSGELYQATYKNTMVTDLKNNKQTSRGSIAFDVIEGENVTINIDSTTTVKQKLDVKRDGAVDLNKMSDEEFEQLQQSIMTNVQLLVDQLNLANSF